MAFMKNINDLIGILSLVVLILPSIAANIDCTGKPFHCVNSTHFMICVDLGSGVSSTIDDFVIPCPPTTECQGTNRFECEFPAVLTTTTTIIAPSAAPQVKSVSETIGIETTTFNDVTTSIPFEEYYNTLSTTTLPGDVLLTQQAIVTESILVTDVTDKTDVITPEFESNSTLSGTIPRATIFTPYNNLNSSAFPTNVSNTATESIFNGGIDTTPNIIVELNLTTLNTELPDKTVDIVTVTENINLIEPKSNLNSNGTIPSDNILGNDSTIHSTQSRSALTDNADAIVKKNIVTEETESENVVRPDPNITLSETPASVEVVPIDLTLLNESDSTGKGSDSFVTNVTDNVVNYLTSLNNSGSTAIVDTEAKVTSMTKNLNDLQPNITFSETPASADVVIHDHTSLDASSSTTIDTEAVTNVTENLNAFEPEPYTTLSNIPESVDVIQNDPTLLNALSSTGIDIEAITNVTENINVIKSGFNTTLRKTPRIDDVITHDPTSLDALNSTANTESVTDETEKLNVIKTKPNTILTETPASVDIVTHEPTSLDVLNSTAIDTEGEANVTDKIKLKKPGPNTTFSGISGSDNTVTHDSTSLVALSSTVIDIEAVTYVTEDLKVIQTEPTTILSSILSETPESVSIVQNNPTSLNTSTTTAIDTKYMLENINVIISEPVKNNIMPAKIDVIPNDPISLTTSSSTAIDTETVANVTDTINAIKIGLNTLSATFVSDDVVTHDSSSLDALSSTAIDIESVTNETENLNDIKTEPNTILTETSASVDVVTHEPTSLDALRSNAVDTEAVSNVTDNINFKKSEPNTTLSGTSGSDDVVSSTAIDTESVTNETEKQNVLQTESNTILTETPASIDVVKHDPTSLDALNSTAIDREAVTNVTENLNVIKTEPTTIVSETPEIVGVVQNNPTPLNTSTTTAIGTKIMIENIPVIKPEPITTLNKIPARIDVILNDPILLTTSSSTVTDTEAVPNVTYNINLIKPAPNTALSGTSGSDDVVTYDPTSLDASSSTAIYTESVTNLAENLNVIKTKPTTILSETPGSVGVLQNNSTSLNTSTTTAIDTKNMIENINMIKPEPVKKSNKMPTRVDVILNDPISLTTSSSTAIETETVTNVTDNIHTIKPGPNTLSETFRNDVVTHDSSSLDALSSTAIDIESVTNETENLNDIKNEPNTILTETPASVDVVTHEPTSLDALSSNSIDTEAVTNVTDTIHLIKLGPNATFSGTSGNDNILTHDPTSLDANRDNINVIKPELNTTLGGTLTSFDDLLTNPTSLSTSSNTDIDSVSNDVLQNEFTTPYTPNSTASLNNIEPVTSDILLIDKTVNENLRILETIRPTQEIDSVTYSNVFHTEFVSVINIGNNQEVLTNQTESKPVHSEKVLSTSTIENTTSKPTDNNAIKDNGIIFTDFLVSVTDAPLPVSDLKPNSNIGTIILDTYPTTTIKKPLTDIPAPEPPTEVTPSLVTTGVIFALDAAVANDNTHNATHLESNSTKKSVKANNEDGSELSPYFTTPEFVSNTESSKEIYFTTAKQLTPVSIADDRNSTSVNDNNQLVTKYNKPMDSSSISSIEKSSAGDTNILVITDGLTTLPTIFAIIETGQEFNSELSNDVSKIESAYLTNLQNTIKVGKVSAVNEAETIATTSTTTDSSKSFGLSSSTNIGQHSTKDINVTAFISETDTDKFYNTRPNTENQTVTIIEEATLLKVNTVSSTTSSVSKFEPTTTEVIEMITKTASKNSYIEPPLHVKSVKTTFSSLFNLQSETTPPLEITTGVNGIGDVLSISFNADQTNISRNLQNTAQFASSTVTQEMVTGLTQTKIPVQSSTTGIVITNTPELSKGSLENTLSTNSLGDGNSLTCLTDSYSSVNEADYTVKAAGENIMFKNTAKGTAHIEHDDEATKESNPSISLLLDSAIVQTLYKEYTIPAQRESIQEETVQVTTTKVDELYEKPISKTSTQIITLMERQAFSGSTKQEIYPELNILNTGSGKPSEITRSIKDMPDVQIKTKWRVIPLIETLQAKQIVVPGQAEQTPVDYLGNVPALHSIATETQIPEEVHHQQSPTAIYEDISHNQQNAVSQQGSTPLHSLDIQPTKYEIITQHIPINTTKIQIELPTNPTINIVNKDTKTTNNASLTKVNKKTETNVPSAFHSQANMQNQDNKVEDSHILAQSGSTSSHSAKNFSPTSIRNSDTLSHLEQNTKSWRATVVTNPSVQMKSSVINKQPLITTTRPSTEPGKISKIEGINVQNTGPNLDVVASNTEKQFINFARVTSPSIIAAKPLIDVTSTTGPPKPSNKISKGVTVPSALYPFITNPNIVAEQSQIVTSTRPNTASWNIQIVNLPSLDPSPKAEPDKISKNIDGGQTTVDHVVSIPKTEFINVPRIVISQTTEQMTTQTSLDLNSDVDIVMVGIMKPINANPVLGEPTGTGTQSGISIIPNLPHKSPVEESEKTEASESVEKSENKESKESPILYLGKSETPESIEGEQNVGTPAIETTGATSKDSKFDNVNDNIDQKSTTRTVDSKLQYPTYKKIEEKADQSISNIEQYSSFVKSFTKNSAQTKVTDVVSPDPKGKSVNIKPIIVTAYNSGNITSTIRNNTDRFTMQTKSLLANKQNSSVPILKSATNSQKFVCKLNKRGRFSDTKDCRKFYICLGRVEPIEGICPNNTVFSELRKQCTKNLSHCVRNCQFQCVSEGRFSDYLKDGIYYICVKNNVGKFIRFKLQCQSGYHLNKTSIRCDLNTESSQSTSQQSTSDISKDSNQSVSWAKSERLVKEPSKNKKFECKKEGKFPEANDCRKYYICKKMGKSQYQQRSKKCDSDELFHKDKKECVDADSYECS